MCLHAGSIQYLLSFFLLCEQLLFTCGSRRANNDEGVSGPHNCDTEMIFIQGKYVGFSAKQIISTEKYRICCSIFILLLHKNTENTQCIHSCVHTGVYSHSV